MQYALDVSRPLSVNLDAFYLFCTLLWKVYPTGEFQRNRLQGHIVDPL